MSTKVEELLNKLNNGETITDYKSNSRLEDHLLACINGTGKEGLGEPKSKIEELLQVHAEQMAGNAGGSVKVSYGGEPTPLICDGVTVNETLYCNISKSIEEVDAVLSQLTYIPNFPQEGYNGYVLYIDGNTRALVIIQLPNAFGDDRTLYMIMDLFANALAYQNYTNQGYPFGWITDSSMGVTPAAPEYPLGVASVSDMEGIPVGAQNDLLVSILAASETFGVTEVKLSGTYDGTPIVASDNVDITTYINEQKLPLKIEVQGVDKLISHDITEVTYDNNTYAKAGTFMTSKKLQKFSANIAIGIEPYMFYNCENLTNINMPKLEYIGDYGLYTCLELTDIDWSNVRTVRDYGCYGCDGFTKINAPVLTTVGGQQYSVTYNPQGHTFQDCSNLTSFIADELQEVVPYMLHNCTSLSEVSLAKATTIKKYAFGSCLKLSNVTLPKVTHIEEYAFNYCTDMTHISIPVCHTIGAHAFDQCSNLETIDCPKFGKVVRERTFNNCKKLKNINTTFTSSIKTSAFANCYSLESISIVGWNGSSIDEQAFFNCRSLKKVFIDKANSSTEQYMTIDPAAFLYCYHILGTVDATYNPDGLKDGYIYVPAQFLVGYKTRCAGYTFESQIVGHQDFVTGDELPSYANDTYTTCTWYSDEAMTTVVTTVDADGKYYCRLEA